MNINDFTFYADKPSQKYHKVDAWLLISMLLLWGFGIFTLFVCSQNSGLRMFDNSFYFVKRQLLCSFIGFCLFVLFLLVDLHFVKKCVLLFLIISVVFCILTFVPQIGVEKNGARRWINLPFGFSFQPSELVKFSLVIFLANYFEKQNDILEENRTVLPGVIVFLILVGIVLLQKDFSTAIFILSIGVLMFIVSGMKILWLLPLSIIGIPAIILMVVLEDYRLNRIIGWLNPLSDVAGINYQNLAAKRAISSGGFWGSGIGTGLQKINSIPEVQADYIFAGWSESMGFFGVIIYFVILGFFAYRGYLTAIKCPERFSAYASFGCVSIIFLQSIMNTMVVCGLIPSTGIPLPFFSLGGSSIIVTFAMCGFILNSSRLEKIDEN